MIVFKNFWLLIGLCLLLTGCYPLRGSEMRKVVPLPKYSSNYEPGDCSELCGEDRVYFSIYTNKANETKIYPGHFLKFMANGLVLKENFWGHSIGQYKVYGDSIVAVFFQEEKVLWVRRVDLEIAYFKIEDSVLVSKWVRGDIKSVHDGYTRYIMESEKKYRQFAFPYPLRINDDVTDMRKYKWFWENKGEWKAWKREQKRQRKEARRREREQRNGAAR